MHHNVGKTVRYWLSIINSVLHSTNVFTKGNKETSVLLKYKSTKKYKKYRSLLVPFCVFMYQLFPSFLPFLEQNWYQY